MGNGESTADSSAAPEQPPVAFVHIPKTAGGTTISMLTNAYGHAGVRDAGNYMRGAERTLSKVGRALRRQPRPQIFAGHVPIGVFRQTFPDDTRYVTILRDPVERVLSHYYRHIAAPRRHDSSRPPQQSLAEVLEQRLPQVSNLQTRFLCDDPDVPAEMPAEALDQAKANLDRMAFVGLQERFHESIVLLQRTLGIDTAVTYDRNRHVSRERPTAEDLDPAQRALIEEANALDIELYEHGRIRFERAVRDAGEGFDVDVENLQARSAAAVSDMAASTAAATQWLQQQMPPGTTRRVTELLDAATDADVPPEALRRAASQMHVKRKSGRDEEGHKVWTRPGASDEAGPGPSKAARRSAEPEARRHADPEARRAAKAERRRNGGKKRRATDPKAAP